MNAIKALLNKNLQSVLVLLLLFITVAPTAFANSASGPPFSPLSTSPDYTYNDVQAYQDYLRFMGQPYPQQQGYHQGASGMEADLNTPVVLPGREWPTPGPPITANMTGPAAARLEYYKKALNLAATGGYLPTNSGYGALKAMETQDEIKDDASPQNGMWAASSLGNMAATSAANSLGSMAENQIEGAIMFIEGFLTNFTAESGNQWQAIRTQLFIPMAILLLLPGAVLAQVKAIIAQGSPILGEVSPFEGLTRSIVAIFMIPATALIMNYGIDVSNAVQYAIAMGYLQTFGSNMYADAISAQQRAFPQNSEAQDANNIPQSPNGAAAQAETMAAGAGQGVGDQTGVNSLAFGGLEGEMFDTAVPDEEQTSSMAAGRLMMNGTNSTLGTTWTIMCAFQMAFLYYLWCMGPIVAALWVWPLERLRGALPSWIEGVVTLCFWSLFWNTTILLMACFKGIGETGTVMMTALNALANICVLYAFDFSSLISQGAASQMVGAVGQALSKASQGGGAGGGGGQSAGGGAKAARGGGGNTGMQTALQKGQAMTMGMKGAGGFLGSNAHAPGMSGHGAGRMGGGMPQATTLGNSARVPTALASTGGGPSSAGGLTGAAMPPGAGALTNAGAHGGINSGHGLGATRPY